MFHMTLNYSFECAADLMFCYFLSGISLTLITCFADDADDDDDNDDANTVDWLFAYSCVFISARKPPVPSTPRYNPAAVYAPSVESKSRDSKDSR